jgi:thiol-disulfide isomerase/thioredoxin
LNQVNRLNRLKKVLSVVAVAAGLALPAAAFAIPQKGRPAPPIKVVTTSGQKISLTNYRGHVLLLEFFATWCGGCEDALPNLIALNKKYGKHGLQVLGLNPGVRGDTADVVKRYMRDKRINFPVAIIDEDLVLDYGVQPIPAIFIIDKSGVLVQKYIGFNRQILESMESTIKFLLADKAASQVSIQ